MDESKNELKTIVSTKIENISEYLRHLNTEPVYRDISKLNRGFFASENRKIFPCFLLHLFTFKRREKKGGSTSLQYIFSTDCTIFPKLETRYTSLPWTRTKKPWVCTTILPPFCFTRRRPFTAISIDKNWLIPPDTIKFHKVLSPPFQTEGLHHQQFPEPSYIIQGKKIQQGLTTVTVDSRQREGDRETENEVKKGSAAQKGGRWSAMTRCPIPSRLKP